MSTKAWRTLPVAFSLTMAWCHDLRLSTTTSSPKIGSDSTESKPELEWPLPELELGSELLPRATYHVVALAMCCELIAVQLGASTGADALYVVNVSPPLVEYHSARPPAKPSCISTFMPVARSA